MNFETLFLGIELLVAIVLFSSWLLLIVYMHYIREYGKSGFKVDMYTIYCSVKEVLSCLYIITHWTCTAIMIWIVTYDYEIDGKTLERYCPDFDPDHC